MEQVPQNRIIPKQRYSLIEVVVAVLMPLFFFAGAIFSRQSTTSWGGFFFFGFIGLVVGYSIYNRWIWRHVWKKLAQEIVLDYHFGPLAKNPRNPRLTGYYRGYSIKVDRVHGFYGLGRVMYTRIQVAHTISLANQHLRVEKKDWFDHIKKQHNIHSSKGIPYAQIGETKLNNLLLIQSQPLDFAQQVFKPVMIRQGLEEVATGVDEMNLTLFNNRLSYYEAGFWNYDVAYLKAVIDWLIEITQQIERVAHQKS
ncbi:MAG: hypothetical protein HUU38_00710 [Anaerolineales bacterium]|nr:hypothetical protein [Anaerolineales bacterium]